MSENAHVPFDLSAFEIADAATFTFKNLKGDDDLLAPNPDTGEMEPVTTELYSPGSKQGVKALHKAGRQAQMRTMRMFRGEVDKDDAQKADDERAEKLAGFVKSISRNFPVAPIDLCRNPRMNWMTRQIEEWLGKDSNFPKSSTGG